MNRERLSFSPESERVNLNEMLDMDASALMVGGINAFARGEIDLPEARRIVAEAAGMALENY